jgi:hypothetical protein
MLEQKKAPASKKWVPVFILLQSNEGSYIGVWMTLMYEPCETKLRLDMRTPPSIPEFRSAPGRPDGNAWESAGFGHELNIDVVADHVTLNLAPDSAVE